MIKQNYYLQLAINEAWKYQLLTYPNPVVGATIVRDGEVLSVEAHKKAGLPHAEVNALKYAFLKYYPTSKIKDLKLSQDIHQFLIKNHNNIFHNCEIYITLEPCNHIGKTPACSILLEKIGIKKVYIGILDLNQIAKGGKKRLEDAKIDVEVLNSKECRDLLSPFIKWKENNFKFFKIAMREDGTIEGGYITTKDSLTLVHEIRTKIDLLIIGGQTVRTDRATLDSRFAKNNIAPNILIYSQQTNFDKTIPLFNILNRTVNISSSLKSIENNNFIMIEGGYNLFECLKYNIDMLMIIISHKEKKQKQLNIETLGFKIIHSYFINKYDEVVFCFK
jgi:diaminohydroxyphosphoribosylaminopyrimidine deaminase/5-amino-6-(5-phosphoribosylamino)uracil reductase